jgi:hypothetical protein
MTSLKKNGGRERAKNRIHKEVSFNGIRSDDSTQFGKDINELGVVICRESE